MYSVNITWKNKKKPPLSISIEKFQSVEILKGLIQQKVKLPINQQRLEYITPKKEKMVLKNQDKLDHYFQEEEQIQLTLKNLGKQISYLNLFLIEYSGPLALWIFFAMINLSKFNSFYFFTTLMVVVHYSKRLWESKFVHIFSNATAPLLPSFKNFIFYWIVFGILVPLELFYCKYEDLKDQSMPANIFQFILLIAFFLFEYGNFYCHYELRKLRVDSEGRVTKGRKVPKGLFFDQIVSPNYTFEILSWITFILLTKSIFALIFILGGGYIMFVWAKGKKRKLLALNISEAEKSEVKKRAMIFPPCL